MSMTKAPIAFTCAWVFGGITVQNGAALIEAGADALAVITALWEAADIEQAAREFSNLFRQGRTA